MLAPEGVQAQACRRIPLAVIDQVVSARLGQTRVEGNAQPAVFHRQIAMYLAKHVGGEHDADRKILQLAGSFDRLLRGKASGGTSRE